MSKRTLIAAAAVASSLAAAGTALSQDPVEWSYEGRTGPAYWAGLSPAFAACGEGALQSPIDLRDARRRWMVLARPITVSAGQLRALERIVEGNARPVQPRNGRRLVLS